MFIEILLGFDENNKINSICKPKKVLLGLKLSPYAWLDESLRAWFNLDKDKSQGDHTIFIKNFLRKNHYIASLY